MVCLTAQESERGPSWQATQLIWEHIKFPRSISSIRGTDGLKCDEMLRPSRVCYQAGVTRIEWSKLTDTKTHKNPKPATNSVVASMKQLECSNEIFNYQYLNQVASSKFPQALLGAFNAAPEHPRKRQSKSADFALLSLLSDHVRLLVCAVVVLFQLARHSEMWRASKFLQPVPLLFHVSLNRKCQVQDLFRRVAAA